MRAVLMVGLFALTFVATAGLSGQEPKPKDGKDVKPDPKAKEAKVEPKTKGTLPQGWGPIGLTAEQKDKVYKLQAKYSDDIDKLTAQIAELKAKMIKERLEILTAEQKKALEESIKKKAGN